MNAEGFWKTSSGQLQVRSTWKVISGKISKRLGLHCVGLDDGCVDWRTVRWCYWLVTIGFLSLVFVDDFMSIPGEDTAGAPGFRTDHRR